MFCVRWEDQNTKMDDFVLHKSKIYSFAASKLTLITIFQNTKSMHS